VSEYLKYDLNVKVDFHRECTMQDEVDCRKDIDVELRKAIKEAIINYFVYKIGNSEYVTGFNIDLSNKDFRNDQ